MNFRIGDEVIFNNDSSMKQCDYTCTFGKPYTVLNITSDKNTVHDGIYLLNVDVGGMMGIVGIRENLFRLHKGVEREVPKNIISELFEKKVKELNNGLF